jgi:Na+-transporting NADH:ubiquinone oxidoreductase subunit NqrE
MRLAACVFGLGVLTDALVAQYYLAISSHRPLAAVILSMAVTVIPLFIAERGINAKRKSLFVIYALGCGIGTLVGMNI